jgi:uncharacterized protein involved in exopolysaccharide biosynthesis
MLGYDIDLVAVLRQLRARIRLIGVFVVGAIVLALIHLHLATYTYTATLMVSPVTSSNDPTSRLQGLSGLASLAGVRMGTDAGTQSFLLYQQAIPSRDVADRLSMNPEIMHTVFRSWDPATRQWKRPSGIASAVTGFIKAVIGIPTSEWSPPGGAELNDYIKRSVTVNKDADSPTVTITFKHRDPKFAVYMLHELDRAVDWKLRQNAIGRATEYVSYLENQLRSVTDTSIREALMATLIDQEKTKMMASATAPYAAQPFGMPSVSRRPTSPKPLLVLVLALMCGGLAGVMAALFAPQIDVKTFSALRLRGSGARAQSTRLD